MANLVHRASNNQVPAALEHYADYQLPKPESALIGRSQSGTFRTAAAKEYPSQLCASFALAFWRRLQQLNLSTADGLADSLATQLAFISGRVDLTKEMKPDYQPSK